VIHMPSPKIYMKAKELNKVPAAVYLFVSVTLYSFSAVLMFLNSVDSTPNEAEIQMFVFCTIVAFIFQYLFFIASYREHAKFIRKIPLVGKIYLTLVSEPTPWGEAMWLNWHLLMLIFIGISFFQLFSV